MDLISTSDGYGLRIMVILATSIFAALALIYASIRHRDVWEEHMKVAISCLVIAGFGTLSYAWVESEASTARQAQLLPYLQLVKDIPGIVIIGYVAVMTTYKVPSIYVKQRTRVRSFLLSAKVVLPAAALLLVAVTVANPDKEGNLDTMLTPWAFAYRTIFCLPLVIFALVSGTVALQSYLSREVSLVRARTGFACGGSYFLALMALSYIMWPIIHLQTGSDPKQTIMYVAVEAALWSAMALCWVGALSVGSHYSSAGKAMQDFDHWHRHADELIGYTTNSRGDNSEGNGEHTIVPVGSEQPDDRPSLHHEAEYVQNKTFEIANSQLQDHIPVSELHSARLSLQILYSNLGTETLHSGELSRSLKDLLERRRSVLEHKTSQSGTWSHESELDQNPSEHSAILHGQMPEAMNSVLIALTTEPYPAVRCLPLPPVRTQLTCIAIAHAGFLTQNQSATILEENSPYVHETVLWAYNFAKIDMNEPYSE